MQLCPLDKLNLRPAVDQLLWRHGEERTFDGRKLAVARRIETRLVNEFGVPAHD